MILPSINLHLELISEQTLQKELLDEIYEFLNTEISKDQEVVERLKKENLKESTKIKIENIDTKRVFSTDTIKKICIRYRLRFLDTSLFRSDFPSTAIVEIKAFEKKYNVQIKSFKIMAPAKAFHLENINKDPLLFAKLNDNTYFLIHQWGQDLSWHRKIFSWPLQNFKNLIISLSLICFLFAFSLPSSIMNIFNLQSEIYLRIWLSIHTFIGLLGITLWLGISFDKTISSLNWDSRYYNN